MSAAPQTNEFLRLSNVHAYYGESHILHGVDLTVRRGEVVTLLGRNGAGRTTTLKSILGLVGRRSGSILINGVESVKLAPHQVARHGIGYCPEERGIFASLSCEENLQLPPALLAGGMDLDEISEGLAPVIVQTLARTVRMLREKGFTIVMVEQNFRFAAKLADHFHVIEHGNVALSFPASELADKQAALDQLLSV